MSVIIYHNPRCSKSRQTLALIEEEGVTPEIFLYLEEEITEQNLESVLGKLGITPRELMRTGEDAYKENNLKDESLSERDLIEAMIKFPKLIQRPIVINGDEAIIGRPPENVLGLLS